MAKTILIIDGHPDPDPGRLCHALCDAYARGAEKAGHDVRRIGVATLDFPVLRTDEEFKTGAPPPDIAAAQEALAAAQHIVIVYPLWLGAMPALLKAFLEQVLRPGFAFVEELERADWPKGRLGGRTARIVITMGMPALAYRLYYLSHSLRSLERNILKLVGIQPAGETLFGLVDSSGEARRANWLAKMEALGRAGR